MNQTNSSKNINNNNNIIEYNKNNQNNSNTVVNFSCFCSKCFLSNEKLLFILPCCHIVHENCFNNYILKCQYKNFDIKLKNKVSLECPQCNGIIKSVLSEYKINTKKKYHQYKVDIKSIRLDNSSIINYMTLKMNA